LLVPSASSLALGTTHVALGRVAPTNGLRTPEPRTRVQRAECGVHRTSFVAIMTE
jgi:hypothetical protein